MEEDYISEPWFFGAIDREEALKLLSHQPLGTFLIRNSKQKRTLAVSLIGATCCRHCLIYKTDEGYGLNNSQMFENLHQFIDYFSKKPIDEQQVLTHPVRKPHKIAKWCYVAKHPSEMSVERGELVRFHYLRGNWAYCVSKDKDAKGFVPADYLDLFDAQSHMILRPKGAPNYYCQYLSAFTLPAIAKVIKNRKPNPFDPIQLQVTAGDSVQVTGINDHGICLAIKDDKEGYLPLSCLNLNDLVNPTVLEIGS